MPRIREEVKIDSKQSFFDRKMIRVFSVFHTLTLQIRSSLRFVFNQSQGSHLHTVIKSASRTANDCHLTGLMYFQ